MTDDRREYFVKPVEKLTAAAQRFKELDRLAFDFGRVQDDMIHLCSLQPEEHAYVMSMAYLYTMYRLGAVSKPRCIEIKKRKIKEVTQIHNSLLYQRHMHRRWIECTKEFYKDYKELTDLIKKSDPQALRKALELVDMLSNQYVYTKLYQVANTFDMQEVLFEELIDEVIAEGTDESKRRELKRLVAMVFEAFEEDELPAFLQEITAAEMKEISEDIPEKKEYVTEEVIKELMPRVS